jgi:hypothetical protein
MEIKVIKMRLKQRLINEVNAGLFTRDSMTNTTSQSGESESAPTVMTTITDSHQSIIVFVHLSDHVW